MRAVQPIFVHGWGFGPDFWSPVQKALGWDNALTLDLGFVEQAPPASFTRALQQLQAAQAPGRAVLGVGHSLGFLWLAQHMDLSPASQLVGINAFAAFAAQQTFSCGIPARVLQRMLKGLADTPEKVLADFRSRCGAQLSGSIPNVPNLHMGLDLLLTGDVRSRLAHSGVCCRVLAARHDPLVSTAMTEESFAGLAEVQWVAGGHLLPQTDVQACAAFLRAARRTMEQDAT